MDRIACPRMRQLKVEQRTRRQAHPGSFQADPRRGVTAQRLARCVRHLRRRQIQIRFAWFVFGSRLPSIGAYARNAGTFKRKRASLFSHASNSGAGRKPNARRRYSAS